MKAKLNNDEPDERDMDVKTAMMDFVEDQYEESEDDEVKYKQVDPNLS